MKALKGIDILKFLFAICVVTIHLKCFTSIPHSVILDWTLSLAVPFFFISTGYLIYNASRTRKDESSSIFRRSRKVFKLFLIWILLYTPIDLFIFFRCGQSAVFFFVKWLHHLAFYGEGMYSWPMWYLYSLWFGLLCLSLAVRFKRGVLWMFGGFCSVSILNWLLTFNILSFSTQSINEHAIALTDRLLSGGVFLTAGYWMAQESKNLRHFSLIPVGLGVSFILFYWSLPLSRLAGATGCLMLGICNFRTVKSDTVKLRKLSVWTFYTHMFVLWGLSLAASHFAVELNWMEFSAIAFLLVFALSCTLLQLSRTRQFGFLNALVK